MSSPTSCLAPAAQSEVQVGLHVQTQLVPNSLFAAASSDVSGRRATINPPSGLAAVARHDWLTQYYPHLPDKRGVLEEIGLCPSAHDIVLLWLVAGHSGMAAPGLKAGCGRLARHFTSHCNNPPAGRGRKAVLGQACLLRSKARTGCSAAQPAGCTAVH